MGVPTKQTKAKTKPQTQSIKTKNQTTFNTINILNNFKPSTTYEHIKKYTQTHTNKITTKHKQDKNKTI